MPAIVVRRLGRVAYDTALALQRELHARVVDGCEPDTVLLLEHDSIYTAGRRTTADERPTRPGVAVVDVDRGGKITWHGPGQLVGYPIVRLAEPIDVVGYVRRLESCLIAACAELGVDSIRVPGRSGVWTSDAARKLAAIGIRVASGVTMHGFALNADASLAAYDAIVACGIRDAGVSSLSLELGRKVTVDDAADAVAHRLQGLGTGLARVPA